MQSSLHDDNPQMQCNEILEVNIGHLTTQGVYHLILHWESRNEQWNFTFPYYCKLWYIEWLGLICFLHTPDEILYILVLVGLRMEYRDWIN